MNAQTCCPEVAASHPLVPRSANLVAPWWQVVAARWAAHLEAARKAREFDFAHELSADTLRDIGAPDRLVSQAELRRESLQQRLWELRQWRDG